ncbi:kinase-like protein [Schizopora paradoxa]|uniref:Kinase-like protein n=1 Tax=Schizopora paradoxa TaxID=27342 RepID=A0A0H2RTM4_9AGAM|nr:kinase-like protein [Schizopora paradoxa]
MGRVKAIARKSSKPLSRKVVPLHPLAATPSSDGGLRPRRGKLKDPTTPKRIQDPSFMAEVAFSHWNNFLEHGSLPELKKAIKIDRQLIKLHSSTKDPREFEATENLGVSLLSLYEKTNEREVLDEAQGLLRTALAHMPEGHPSVARAKINLGNAWRARSELMGEPDILDIAIDFYEAGLSDTPADHPSWDMEIRKSCLARSLIARGTPADLSRAMSLMATKAVRGNVQLQLSSLPTRQNILGLPVPDLTAGIRRITDFPSGCGGFADIYMSEWIQPRKGRCKVAVKVLRSGGSNLNNPEVHEKLEKLLKTEVGIWHELNHPNVVKLLGTCNGFGPYASMVCPWYANGNLPCFIQKHKSLIYSERLRLIREIASGLYYLHTNAIIHGDLTGANILIDDDQHACLSDFGLSVLAQDLELPSMSQSSSSMGGSLRWTAPELFSFEENATPKVSLFSDVYSFGSVALEVFTGDRPYHYVQSDMEVLLKYIVNRIKPARPKGIQDDHWQVVDQCWATDPQSRPSSRSLSGLFTCIE